jgi:hypothetical protein
MSIALGTAVLALTRGIPELQDSVARVEQKVDAHLVLHHPVREEAISSQDLREALTEHDRTESIRIKAIAKKWTGAFFWSVVAQSWKIVLAGIIGLVLSYALGWVSHGKP